MKQLNDAIIYGKLSVRNKLNCCHEEYCLKNYTYKFI